MVTEEKHISRSLSNHVIPVHKNITMEELEHIASCDICAIEYTKVIEEQAMIKAPHYLKDNILEKTRALSKVQQKASQKDFKLPWKKLQLLRYSFKIGLAMCGALTILFLTPAGNVPRGEPPRMESFLIKMNTELKEFSNNITDYTDQLVLNNTINSKEDFKYDKKEK